MTAPPDIAIQVLLWLAAAGIPANWEAFLALRPALGSADLVTCSPRYCLFAGQVCLEIVKSFEIVPTQPAQSSQPAKPASPTQPAQATPAQPASQ